MNMIIQTSDTESVKKLFKDFSIPSPDSHKGQNGKVLIIGGSQLFHSAMLWSAEIASHFSDLVHFASTEENNQIFQNLKEKFRNGMVVSQKDLEFYIKEDNVILLGPGMVRTEREGQIREIGEIRERDEIEDEGVKTYAMTQYLLSKFPEKKWVIDAGALQMLELEWLQKLKEKPILTPHKGEFERVFGIDLEKYNEKERSQIVAATARKHNCVILLKIVIDIISDGTETYVIKGGNQGLTKGGSGDALAGLTASLYAKNNPLLSAVFASVLVKKAADELSHTMGYWYNTSDLIEKIPQIVVQLAL